MSFEFDDRSAPSPQRSAPQRPTQSGPTPLPPSPPPAWGQAAMPSASQPFASESFANAGGEYPVADPWYAIASAEPAPPALAEPKFCGRCGNAWVPANIQCGCGYSLERPPTAEELSAAVDRQRRIEETIARDQASLKSALWLYFAQLIVCIGLLIFSMALDGDVPLSWYFGGDAAMALVTMCWVVPRWNEVGPLVLARTSVVWYLVAPVCALGTYFVAAVLVRGLASWAGMPEVGYMEAFDDEGYGFGWAVLSICVMPAVFEELAFRGVILEALSGFLHRNEAILVSALLFAILHLSIASIPHLCLIGIILAKLRYLSGSILPGILMHFTHNLLVISAEHFGDGVLPW